MTAHDVANCWTVGAHRAPLQQAARASSRMSLFLDKSIAAGLLAAIVFTGLAHGAVEPWSLAVFELILMVVLLLWGIKATLDKRLAITVPAAALPVAALLLLGIAQSVVFTGEAGERSSLSMDVEATRYTVLALFFLAASFVVAANFFVTRERLWLLASLLTVFGGMVAAMVLMAILNRRWTVGAVYGRAYSDALEPKRFRLSRLGPIAVVSLSMIAGVFWIGATPIIERFGRAVDQLVRSGTPDVSRAMMWNET